MRVGKLLVWLCLGWVGGAQAIAEAYDDQDTDDTGKKNVLMIIVDDMRALEDLEGVRTPALDAFEKRSVAFKRAYANLALCGPSRASFLSARFPWSMEYYSHGNYNGENMALWNALTMPDWFHRKGYRTKAVSKIFHHSKSSSKYFNIDMDKEYEDVPVTYGDGCDRGKVLCGLDPNQYNFVDEFSTTYAINTLTLMKNRKELFFLAVGIRRPHLPFRVPQEYVKMYEGFDFKMPPDEALLEPRDSPKVAHSVCENLFTYKEMKDYDEFNRVSNTMNKYMRMGYYAAVSWSDANIGKILNHLQVLGLENNTLVVIMSDHGWSIGEHMAWCKRSAYEVVAKAPVWIRDPGNPELHGTVDRDLFNLVDIFPTIAELAGIPLPALKYSQFPIQGISQGHRLRSSRDVHPTTATVLAAHNDTSTLKNEYVFTIQPACFDQKTGQQKIVCGENNVYDYMGVSVRTDRYLYTEWRRWIQRELRPDFDFIEPNHLELFDNTKDPYETINLAKNPTYGVLISDLSKVIRRRYTKCENANNELNCGKFGSHCIFLEGACRPAETKCIIFSDRPDVCVQQPGCTFEENACTFANFQLPRFPKRNPGGSEPPPLVVETESPTTSSLDDDDDVIDDDEEKGDDDKDNVDDGNATEGTNQPSVDNGQQHTDSGATHGKHVQFLTGTLFLLYFL